MHPEIKFLVTFFSLSILFFACDRPACKNNNPIFDKYAPTTEEYKTELVKQLGTIDKSNLTYWFSEYAESSGQELLYFHVQGEGLCAQLVLSIDNWNKLEELRLKKGLSYRGAEFTNLRFDIKQDSLGTQFIYRDFDKIID